MKDDLFTIRETAAVLHVSVKTIRRMLKSKRLRGAFRVGAGRGDWRIPASTIEAYKRKSAA